jgi:hypothetical protein
MNSAYALPVLKELYAGQTVENMSLKDHAFWAMVPKNPKFFGKIYPQPIQYSIPVGRSATFTNAKANKTNSKFRQFALVRYKDYALVNIDNEDMEASENDKGAFVELLKTETDGAIQAAVESAARDVYGTGSGVMARLNNAGVATAVAILLEPRDALKFEEGMVIVLSAANGGGAVKAGTLTVLSVERSAGTVTFTTTIVAGVATAAVNDFLFVQGDYDLKMPGLLGWLPTAAPTGGDNFFGVDRSVDPDRLGGYRFNGTTMSIEEALITCQMDMYDRGARPSHVFLSSADYANLEIQLGAKVQYIYPTAYGRADINFKGIQLHGRRGDVTVLNDIYCPVGRGFMLQMNTWKLHSLKAPIRILAQDGNKYLRNSDADSEELRVGGYKVLGCGAPGWNANISL